MQHQLTYTKKQWLKRWIIYHVTFLIFTAVALCSYFIFCKNMNHLSAPAIAADTFARALVFLIPISYITMTILNISNDKKRAVSIGVETSKVIVPRIISLIKVFGGTIVLGFSIFFAYLFAGGNTCTLSTCLCILFAITFGFSAAHIIYLAYIFGIADIIEEYELRLWSALCTMSFIFLVLIAPISLLVGIMSYR